LIIPSLGARASESCCIFVTITAELALRQFSQRKLPFDLVFPNGFFSGAGPFPNDSPSGISAA
jgi:hypothetical protein